MRGLEQIPWLYDPVCALYEWLGLGRWRRWLVEGARGLALDVGCGTGRNLPLYREGVRVSGLDPAWESLQRARQRAPRARLVRGSAEALPFRDGAFDTVVSGLVFCSVPDARRGLAEVRRVLRPDCRLPCSSTCARPRRGRLGLRTGSSGCGSGSLAAATRTATPSAPSRRRASSSSRTDGGPRATCAASRRVR